MLEAVIKLEDYASIERDKQQAEIFDALGHTTRIAILKALSGGSLGFADLKKKTGIQSSGHLQHHITKLGALLATDEYGRYCLSDQGKDALLSVGTVEKAAQPPQKPRPMRISAKKLAALLLIAIVAATAFTTLTIDRLQTHERWATEFRLAQHFHVATDNHDIEEAYYTLHELQRVDQQHSLELSQIDAFLMWYRNPDLNDTDRAKFRPQIREIGNKVISAYGSILNYTSMNYITGPSFWYFGPPSPNETILKEAADIAVQATTAIPKPVYFVTPVP
jgi:DNA-binding transcriptional ArsR family regulator